MHQTSTLIAIVNYRTPEMVVNCLDSLEPEIRANPGASVIVVDNASGDRSIDIIGGAIKTKDYGSWCRLVAAPRNGGFSYGNNLAVRTWRERTAAADGGPGPFPDYLWLLNPDTLVLAGALRELLAFMESRPEVGIAGGRSVDSNGNVQPCGYRFHSVLSELDHALKLGRMQRWGRLAALPRLLTKSGVGLPAVDVPTPVGWVEGSTFFVRGEVLERIGLFDEGYFLYFEEVDFCFRAARAGFPSWYVPASTVVHVRGQSTGVGNWSAVRRPPFWFASRARFLRLRYGIARSHLINVGWLLLHPIGWLFARARGLHRKWPPLMWWDFLRHTYGPGARRYRP